MTQVSESEFGPVYLTLALPPYARRQVNNWQSKSHAESLSLWVRLRLMDSQRSVLKLQIA